jgi:hypothetical protein
MSGRLKKQTIVLRPDTIPVTVDRERAVSGREYDSVMFVSEVRVDDSDPLPCVVELSMDAQMWREFGKPKQITLQITPGDTLNGGGNDSR